MTPFPQQPLTNRIELLSVELLDQERELVNSLKQLASRLRLEFGWHYLLDLAWILRQLGPVQGLKLMDAGAGVGLMQWFLAEQGAEVISVDRSSRVQLPLQFRRAVRVRGLRPGDLAPASQVFLRRLPGSLRHLFPSRPHSAEASHPAGQVLIYNQDLAHLVDIPEASLDAVVAVSALEHNTPEGLQQVVGEIMRVLKPGGALLATLTAAADQDTWHAPSAGWCYTDATLRRLFDLPAETPSNYDHYEELMAALRECAELRENLASFYFKTGDNGMPWGRWDPQYQPVGVCKVKLEG